MIEVITNLDELSLLLKVDAKKKFTAVSVGYDSYKTMGPKLVKHGNKTYLFACHLEKGNIRAQKEIEKTFPSDIKIIYYEPFFTFENDNTFVYPDFMNAFGEIAKEETDVILGQDIPVALYESFDKNFNVFFQNKDANDSEYYQYVLSKKEVLDKFNFQRDQANSIAIRLIGDSARKNELERFIYDRKDTRFEVLDLFMKKEKLDAVFCTSPISIQETTGHGLQNYREKQFASLYIGGDSVFLFSKQPLEKGFGKGEKVNIFSVISQNVGRNDVLGIEKNHCPTSLFKGLENITENIQDSMTILRKNREIRGWEDLSYYIIASRATVYAIEGALEWAQKKIGNGEKITELNVENEYNVLLQRFREKYHIPFNIIALLTICCAGNRDTIPSLPTNFPLTPGIKSLKLDAGVSVCDSMGIHHAASDITRTLLFQKEIEQAYRKLEEFMFKKVIPNIKPQMKGKDIYHLAVSQIENSKNFFKQVGLLSPEVLNFEDIFNRNVGHLMGLQEPVTLFFLKNATDEIETGMIGAIEYQWHTRSFGIGIEDNFIVGPTGGLNFSRGQ